MSRPLVIKIASHNTQPNSKATGSIDLALLTITETKSPEEPSESHDQSSSLVRNLVNKYESSPSATNLVKYKSKSMVDLNQHDKPIQIQNTQDDILFHKTNGNFNMDEEVFEEWRHNFKHALNKFQTTTGSHHASIHNDRPTSAHDIRQKAQRLLETTKHDYFWFNQVMELLQQIVSDKKTSCTNDSANHSTLASTASSSSRDDNLFREPSPIENNYKVSEIKQMYEKKASSQNADISKNTWRERDSKTKNLEPKSKVPLKYFGKGNEDSDRSTLTDTDPFQIKNSGSFERYDDDFETIDIGTHNSLGSEEVLAKIEEMMKRVEECDKKVDDISVDNKAEANYINDILINVLVTLDDLRTYDDEGKIITMKRKAFGFTQDCIKKLKVKVFGDDI